jgi:hypothetical protein
MKEVVFPPSEISFDQIFEPIGTVTIVGKEVAPLFSPGPIYIHGERIHISDVFGNKVSIYNNKDGKLLAVLGKVRGKGPGEFQTPESIIVDQQGFLYVNDRGNGRIQIFDSSFNLVKLFPVGMVEQIMVRGSGKEVVILCVNVAPVPCEDQKGKCLLQEYDWNGKSLRIFGQYEKPILVFSWVSTMDSHGRVYISNVLDSYLRIFNTNGAVERLVSFSTSSVIKFGSQFLQHEPRTASEMRATLKALREEKHTQVKTILVKKNLVFVVHAVSEKEAETQHIMDVFDLEGNLRYEGIKAPGRLLRSSSDYFYFLTKHDPEGYGQIEIRGYRMKG